jgi:cell division protein FtsI (penicillin-binding protein 3)
VLRTKKGSNNYYGGQIALPVFKEVANRLFAINMHNVNSISKQQKVNEVLAVKSMKGSEYDVLAQKLNILKKAVNTPNWIQNIQTDSMGNFTYSNFVNYKNAVPDVNGMGMKDAIYLLEKIGLKVIPVGKGKVDTQSMLPGSNFKKGQKISILLS